MNGWWRRIVDSGRRLSFLDAKRVLTSCLVGIVLSAGVVTSPTRAWGETTRIRAIDIEGAQHIEAQAIASKLTLKIGEPFIPQKIRTEIQRIYGMGFFEDVQVETTKFSDGIQVTFHVKEKPFNVETVFDGNHELSEDTLKEKVTVQSQVFLDQEQVNTSAENIRQAYQDEGYYHASVIPVIEVIGENRDRLTFFIQEGPQAHIKHVTFEGRSVVSRKELLGGMATREWSLPWSWFTDAGILKKEEIPNDVERIKEAYMNRGYLDVQVGTPSITLDDNKESFDVNFPIVEGEPYIVSRVTFKDNTVFTDKELKEGLSIHSGEVFQRAKVREEITRLTDLYGERGYAFAEPIPSIQPDPESRSAEIVFTIKEGELIRIRNIQITGNNKTRDNVIRRELRVDERDMIDSVAMKRSFERLNNLNFFETVEILPEQISDGEVDLEVKVKEKPTGSFSVGGGFSTLDQFTAIADITEGNLLGLGYTARIRGQVGGRRTLGVLTFRNPALYDGLTSMQIDGFQTNTDFVTYREKKTGGNITFGRAFSEYISGNFTLVGERIRISHPRSDAPELILDQVGTQTTTGFRTALFRDSRDFYLDPRSGTRVGVNASFGTELLGGTNDFYSFAFDALKYTPLPFWDLRIATRGRVGLAKGYNGDAVPLSELFFVGGINTVRGFKFGRAGPVTSRGTLVGATKQLIFNVDLIFPVLPEAKFNGVVFFDYGEGFSETHFFKICCNLRPTTGLEVRWISPFGPLRAAYGIPLSRRNGEKKGVFEFSVGSVF
ncbi:MAG: outer membrane protein assembly factor BamA [Nitrospirales bacterium]|nr:outer membrane protein assembly factor BamA [Nitrospira sp.]MDR4502385.1 outer membrane protein assembly factor BamA [Nitrospirales bacterium]